MRQWIILAFVVIALCAAFFLRSGKKDVERELRTPFEQLGQVLAEETLAAVPGTGRITVLRYRLVPPMQNTVLDAATETFLHSIRKDGRLQIVTVVEDTFNPLNEDAGWENTLMESSRFVDFLAAQTNADAVVVIGGTPALNEKDLGRLASPRPKVLVAAVLTPPAGWLLTRGVITTAIISGTSASQDRTPPRTPREWFDRRYKVLHGQQEVP